jgi:CheY-like chemotaxis protein
VHALLLDSLGHTVIEASSGEDGIARLETEESVDLVLTDLGMPGLSGWDVVRAVRERWPSLYIGIISGDHASLAERRAPVDIVIMKPVGRDILKALLACLDQS